MSYVTMVMHLTISCVSSVAMLDTLLNTSKTAEQIEVPFEMWTLVDPRTQGTIIR